MASSDGGVQYEALRPTLTHEVIAWLCKTRGRDKVNTLSVCVLLLGAWALQTEVLIVSLWPHAL